MTKAFGSLPGDSAARVDEATTADRLRAPTVFAEPGTWTGVGWYFSASHNDLIRKQLHGHSYEVTAWFPAEPPRDAVVLQETLKGVLRAFDHTTLTPELTRGEALAQAIGGLMSDCVGIDLSRPVERIHARWRV